jgi:hypothetical protein
MEKAMIAACSFARREGKRPLTLFEIIGLAKEKGSNYSINRGLIIPDGKPEFVPRLSHQRLIFPGILMTMR